MKNIYTYTIFLVLASVTGFAQPSGKVSAEQYITTAQEAVEKGNHFASIGLYEAAYQDSKDTEMLPGLVKGYYKLRDYNQAIKWAKEYLDKHEGKKDTQLRTYYAMALKSMGRYSEAIKQLTKLERYNLSAEKKAHLAMLKQGAELAHTATAPKGVSVSNIGKPINAKGSEYAPFLSATGDLYFAALRNEEILDADDAGVTSMIFHAKKTADGFSTPKAFDKIINDPKHYQSNLTFLQDGKTMIFARQTVSGEGKIQTSRLYSSTLNNERWSRPKALYGIKKGVQYKSPSYGRYMDKDVIFFVSNAKDSKGGYDIYYAPLRGDGKLGEAVNMGATINTASDEESPFYKDGTLYFSSKGHPSYGGYDIYAYDLIQGGAVRNMGLPYNSPADDLYFMMADDYEGVMVSNRADGDNLSLQSPTCCNDIYSVSLVNLQLEAIIADADSGLAVEDATVVVMDAAGSKISPQIGAKGLYKLVPDASYTIEVSKEGYEPTVSKISTADMWSTKTISERINLVPIKVTPPPPAPEVVTVVEPIVLEEILFDYGDDKILPQAEGDLAYLLKIMREYPDMKIRISSHTDARGGIDYNQKLSQRRSNSVRNWLIAKGVNRSRIVASGLGSSKPLKANAQVSRKYSFIPSGTVLDAAFIAKLTKEQKEIAHQLNRRSDFEILEGPKVIIKKQ